MDSSIFFGGSLVAAVIAGAVALFAPCCISVMLPGYLATAFQNRRRLVAMTFLYGVGVATVILPIALGAAVVQRFIVGQHTAVYLVAGVALLALAAYTLAGGQVHLPMPGRRVGRTGPLGVYSLGVFSGVASSCCAPVLAGVIALSGIASSFAVSLGLGAAYVFGMVAPLFVISLLWERFDLRGNGLLRPRSFTWRFGPVQRTITGTALLSGVLLALMGAGTVYIGLAGAAMPSASGWQADVSAELQHYGKLATDALSWLPGWAGAAVLGLALTLLGRRAFRQLVDDAAPARRPGADVGEGPSTGARGETSRSADHEFA